MYKRCIILLADGSRPDIFEEHFKKGNLPNIQRYLLEQGDFRRAISTFPSTTGPAYLPFLTGCFPGTCNVPGIRWLDKKEFATKKRGRSRFRSYVGFESFLMGRDVYPHIPTIFELIEKSYSFFNPITRGVSFNKNLTKMIRIWYWYYAHLTDHWKFIDENAVRFALKAAEKDFQFLFFVMPGIDEYSHIASPFHQSARDEYLVVDEAVGKICKKLDKLGKLEDTLFWIVSDHGLSETHTHFCINDFLEKRDIKTFYYPLIFRKNCIAANMVSGNGMSHLYFKNKDGWLNHTTRSMLEGMYPKLLHDLLAEEAIDVIAVKNDEGGVDIITERGEAKTSFIGEKLNYDIVGERGPFGYDHIKDADPIQSLAATFDNDYPDAPFQLTHVFTSPRCGDVILSAKPGFDLREKYEVPEHKASHGGLHCEHMQVPLLCNAKLKMRPTRTADVFPTILKLLNYPIPEHIDGVSLV
ncbi:alkaline phosphatase family protein [bacterium]|nr:alkaline phosphatase family protein [bacterium]